MKLFNSSKHSQKRGCNDAIHVLMQLQVTKNLVTKARYIILSFFRHGHSLKKTENDYVLYNFEYIRHGHSLKETENDYVLNVHYSIFRSYILFNLYVGQNVLIVEKQVVLILHDRFTYTVQWLFHTVCSLTSLLDIKYFYR